MNLTSILNSAIYAVLGVIIFCVIFVIVDLVTPYHLWKEVIEKQNTALAVLLGFAALGICVIVAAAIH